MHTGKKRVLAVMLVFLLLFSAGSGYVSAEETSKTESTAGLCEHHPEHTEDCGYESDGQCSYQCDLCGDSDRTDITDDQGETENSDETDRTDETDGADENNAAQTTEWTWNDSEEIIAWSEENGRWEAAFPGASEEQPLTSEALASMLPQSVTVQTDGEEKEIPIVWDLTALSDGMYEGEIVITANPAEDLAEAEGIFPVSVTVTAGGAETMGVSDDVLEANKVEDTVSPKGTTIDLFNYTAPVINDGHTLEFNSGSGTINANKWTGYLSGNNSSLTGWVPSHYDRQSRTWVGDNINGVLPLQGIVERTLEDGYPKLQANGSTALGGTTGIESSMVESLAYLFDESEIPGGKETYTGVQNLLQVDEDGYFYYDSKKNFAEYVEDTNSFNVYNAPGVKTNDEKHSTDGWFFPFNDANQVFDIDEDGNLTCASVSGLDYHFGVHMSTRFIQQDGGYTTSEQNQEVHYKFSGDDDVLVYIDDVLVADLSGIHDAVNLDINFATGEILIRRMAMKSEEVWDEADQQMERHVSDDTNGAIISQTNLKAQFAAAGITGNFDGNTFADDTYHTLDFFYLERGQGASNMSLYFNLVEIPETDIIKVDQLGNPVPGAEFKLYGYPNDSIYDKNDKEPKTLTNYYSDTENKVKYGDAVEVATGTTGANGEFVLTNDDGVVSLNEIARDYTYFVLEETEMPEGYRGIQSIPLYMHYAASDPGTVALLSADYWSNGAYATPNALVSAPSKVVRFDNGEEIDPADGIMFAVPMKYVGPVDADGNATGLAKADNWLPVYGEQKSGWTLGTDESMSSIVAAAKENATLGHRNEFKVSSSGAYTVEISNLPGDIEEYYFMLDHDNPDAANGDLKTKYVTGYFFAEGVNSVEEITDPTSVVRLDCDGVNEGAEAFGRVFGADLYISNIRNYVLVQKLDEDGNALEGAEFTLYEGGSINVDGTFNATEAKEIEKNTTTNLVQGTGGSAITLKGGAVFPSNADTKLVTGKTYYLVETKAPDGYAVNDQAVEVYIDDSGVYADAGEADDGIRVARGVGSVVKSMLQYVTSDAIDTTLHDIKANLYTSDQKEGENTAWNWTATQEWTHLQYNKASAALEYAPYSDAFTAGLITDRGWSKLQIQQCLEHDDDSDTKQNLGDKDLTNLYSGSVTVLVTDKKTNTLTVSKEVDGDSTAENQEFTFNVTLTDENGVPLTTPISTLKYTTGEPETGEEGSISSNEVDGQWVYTFKLKHNQSIDFKGLPKGTKYVVTEEEAAGFTTTVSADGTDFEDGSSTQGTVPENASAKAVFRNTVVKSFAFTKVEKGGTTPLSGAGFVLYELVCEDESHDHSEDLIEIDDSGEIKTGYEYKDCWKKVDSQTSGGDGAITFNSLKASAEEFRLIEFQAPDGFICPDGQWIVTYDETKQKFTVQAGGSIGNPPAYNGKDDTIINYKPGELPFTGNTGIKIFLMLGAVLMAAGGGAGLWYYKRRQKVANCRVRRRRR